MGIRYLVVLRGYQVCKRYLVWYVGLRYSDETPDKVKNDLDLTELQMNNQLKLVRRLWGMRGGESRRPKIEKGGKPTHPPICIRSHLPSRPA